ncbi:Peptidase inhibitor 16 [Heterocephalus glaber]|uniref:Peptidase inhibitor 16 n=1 Tax=Heterocephalus glaber TaxID=10181 RepID=G5B536_HETGA|nr:Peptidase inhibitor 16 [Heterocephalus glaber]
MVQLHNLYRAQVSPPASDMLRMRWDPELAAFAKAHAQKCVWSHNKDRGRRGENLFGITDEGLDVPLAVEEWHRERQHYNLSAASCAAGQMCGHYTQVVWGKTERIGCGSHFCETLQGVEENNIHLLVCNYEPPATEEVAPKTSASPARPESSRNPKGELLPLALDEVEAEAELPPSSEVLAFIPPAQGEAEAEAELPPPSEALATVFPAQAKPGELQATLDRPGHAKSLPSLPSDSASDTAKAGRTLALHSSFPGAEGPESPGGEPRQSTGHARTPALGLLLLAPLLWAGLL